MSSFAGICGAQCPERAVGRYIVALALGFVCLSGLVRAASAEETLKVWHFASNGNFNPAGAFAPARAGFDLADVSSSSQLDLLPQGTEGLVWLGQCDGVTAKFMAAVNAVIEHPKTFGFYLMDDPDPSGMWRPLCKGSDLRAESDWIHQRRPGVVTFVALMNLGSLAAPRFSEDYNPEASHVDLFGVAPYPCRANWPKCDLDMIDRFVAASLEAGFPIARIVPTFQTFGGGEWRSDGGGGFRLPSASEMQSILERWYKFSPAPVFDYAYSWGRQRADESLETSAELQAVFERRNRPYDHR